MGFFDVVGEMMDTAVNPLSSIVKQVFCDQVNPKVGSVVRTDLLGGLCSHTGIYVGHNKIVEITEIDGKAVVREVTPKEFVTGPTRTGVYIYVAAAKCGDELYALASADIAKRATEAIGGRGKYFTLCNNCHQFTRYCITGFDDESSTPWGVDDIVEALKDKFSVEDVYWRGTGDYLNLGR